MLIRMRKSWELPGLRPTAEEVYWDRRRFLAAAGLAGLSLAALGLPSACLARHDEDQRGESGTAAEGRKPGTPGAEKAPEAAAPRNLYPAPRNPKYTLDRPLTKEQAVISYNNFYEFSYRKHLVAARARKMVTSPWAVEIGGLVRRPITLDVDDLLKRFPLEERLYRFRCVEAWAMAVPWTGFPLKALLDFVEPLARARYVRFVTFHRPEWAPNLADDQYPWPYHEALSIAEASHELTILATGLYGKPLPNQNGAPVRLIVPWKYGFKSIKSIVRIELTEGQPRTFWNTAVPKEYDFLANVDPGVPHPRWSQAQERMIDTQEVVPTQLYNGYAELVAKLYG
jgi:sulfoxide reductase catalytic subunit YedY